jgi:hypothetical protein
MFILVIQTLQKKWNEICMKQLAGEKHMENDCFPRTLKLKMLLFDSTSNIFPRNLDVVQSSFPD